ncbi:site-specific integrase [Uliginosibacterium aquaticum]|uniref:Site-specific integrase n=1 Tax=Uliginosibacterium aquaticum TaxID=2731212 RepID=A0ABX2IGR6_9RHOO|nr:site-specific integrase [Uliginosibacterium aquaticum]NSL53546.1 site-specific integrase [Uliginosibacterium aquaticum]
MARLEYIRYQPHRPEIVGNSVQWVSDAAVRAVERLPQIFWADGQPWNEANLWALEMSRSRDVKAKTVQSLMEHLHKYAKWLVDEQIDWRHFPKNKAERVLIRYRGFLIDSRDRGGLSPSTTTARMRAVIRFYRFSSGHNFISHEAPKWQDRVAVVRYFDSVGFERTLQRITTDISIPNRARPGVRLEDGLLPITAEHMQDLLRYTTEHVSEELHLMLLIGFFTGARLGTITSMKVPALENALRDPGVPGMWVVPVGPGTGISTKFDVSGDLLIPDELMRLMKAYSTSARHLDRVIKADKSNKACLFLTRFGNPFKPAAVNREMVDLRRQGICAGLKFLLRFHFHQTRATYGTWLMSISIGVGNVKAAIEFVRRAMHHRHESTTFRYITFIEHTKAKIEVASAFTLAFFGVSKSVRPRNEKY